MKFALSTAALVACVAACAQLASADSVHRDVNSTRSLADAPMSKFFQMCGATIFVQDHRNIRTPNPVDCGVECKKTNCGAVSWNDRDGGTCWINDQINVVLSTNIIPMAEAESFFSTASPMIPALPVDFKYGMDMVGFDLTSTRRDSSGLCVSDCMDNAKCFAVTWTDYNGGTCWLKKRASSYVLKEGAVTYLFARAVTTPTACP